MSLRKVVHVALLTAAGALCSGCVDYTWEPGSTWIQHDYAQSGYCVLLKHEGWRYDVHREVVVKCGLSVQEALTLRDKEAQLLHVEAK